jgi:hypothetical protein
MGKVYVVIARLGRSVWSVVLWSGPTRSFLAMKTFVSFGHFSTNADVASSIKPLVFPKNFIVFQRLKSSKISSFFDECEGSDIREQELFAVHLRTLELYLLKQLSLQERDSEKQNCEPIQM